MFKKLCVLIVLSAICFGAQAQQVDIFRQKGRSSSYIIVRGNTGGFRKPYWLGVSYQIGNGPEIDLKVGFFRARGKFEKKFKADALASIIGKAVFKSDSIRWIAKLWKQKVPKRKCTKMGGGPCSYCRRKGYHLEGQVASKSVVGNLK